MRFKFRQQDLLKEEHYNLEVELHMRLDTAIDERHMLAAMKMKLKTLSLIRNRLFKFKLRILEDSCPFYGHEQPATEYFNFNLTVVQRPIVFRLLPESMANSGRAALIGSNLLPLNRFSYGRTKVAVRRRECSGMERQADSHCGAGDPFLAMNYPLASWQRS
eukprot:IDg11778t1